MRTCAYFVRAPGHREVTLDRAKAVDNAAKHRGTVEPCVLLSEAQAEIAEAYERGRRAERDERKP